MLAVPLPILPAVWLMPVNVMGMVVENEPFAWSVPPPKLKAAAPEPLLSYERISVPLSRLYVPLLPEL